jgi:hypothetical protein
MPQAKDYVEEVSQALSIAIFPWRETAVLAHAAEPVKRLKAEPPALRLEAAVLALEGIPLAMSMPQQVGLRALAGQLLQMNDLPLTPAIGRNIVALATGKRQQYPHKAILKAVATLPLDEDLRHSLVALRESIDLWHGKSAMEDLHERIDEVLHGKAAPAPVAPAGPWTQKVFAATAGQAHWQELFLFARGLTQSTASKKWLAEGAQWVDRIGREKFRQSAQEWLALGPMPETPGVQVPEEEADYQKGFLWVIGASGDVTLCQALGDFAEACLKKIPQIGAVSQRVGNACVNVLAMMPGLAAVSELSRLAVRVKYDVAQRLIEKALAEAALANGVSRDDLEAMSVPATLPPAEGSKDKKAQKDYQTLLATQRMRLEGLLGSEGFVAAHNWREWYLDHVVVGDFARRLIWETGGQTAIWQEGKMVDWAGQTVEIPAEAQLRLWHPIRSDVQTVMSWRCWLEDHGIRQPFKQAHREVYLLTEAERATGNHSHRFAAHVIRQHQFAALAREQGWDFQLMGAWDSHNNPRLEIPRFGLAAEWDVDFPANEQNVSAHRIYMLIHTGALRFYRAGSQEALALDTIPPLVLSETLRDLDLFTSVCSIGTDPLWGQNNPGGPFQAYWDDFAYGERSSGIAERKAVLERLLPKIGLGAQCRLEGHFLWVQGTRGQYRIHLGSANVQMEPGSRHLCIVQGPGDSAAALQLPFDGDRVLSMILSKAILLVNDAKIKDQTILKQLR